MKLASILKWGAALVVLGIIGFAAYFAWTVSVKDLPAGALVSDANSTIVSTVYGYAADPVAATSKVGLIFIAGAFVPAQGYVPFARSLAAAGHPVRVIGLAWGVAQLPGQQAELVGTVDGLISDDRKWVIAGHSLGSYYASQFALAHPDRVAGLFIVGSGYPYVDLSQSPRPLVMANGSNDNVVHGKDDSARKSNMPKDALMISIEGGNHAGFAYYGPQLGDGTATIPKAEQQAQMVDAALGLLDRIDAQSGTAGRDPLSLDFQILPALALADVSAEFPFSLPTLRQEF